MHPSLVDDIRAEAARIALDWSCPNNLRELGSRCVKGGCSLEAAKTLSTVEDATEDSSRQLLKQLLVASGHTYPSLDDAARYLKTELLSTYTPRSEFSPPPIVLLKIEAARHAIGFRDFSNLPEIGVECLLRDIDTQSIRLLAGLPSPPEPHEAEQLLLSVLDDLSINLPDAPVALKLLADRIADEVLIQLRQPYDGALAICNLHRSSSIDDFSLYGPIIYVEDEYLDHPEDQIFWEFAIIAVLREFLDPTFDSRTVFFSDLRPPSQER